MAAVLLTHAPKFATDVEALQAISAQPETYEKRDLEGASLLDLCAGSCSVAAAASRLGAAVTAIDRHPISILIGRAELVYPKYYGAADPNSTGNSQDRTWQGLGCELSFWSDELIDRAARQAGDNWLNGIEGILCTTRFACPRCGHEAPANPSRESQSSFGVTRGHGCCPNCDNPFRVRDARPIGAEARSFLPDGTLVPVGSLFADLVQAKSYPSAPEHQLDDCWAFDRSGPIVVRNAVTPRQYQVIRAFRDAFRSIRNDLADHGYSPEHAVSLLTYLALALSSVVANLSRFTWWNARTRRVQVRNVPDWLPNVDFIEIGGAYLERALRKRFSDSQTIIASADPKRNVMARTGDMTRLDFGENSFDLVVWDPPFYDQSSCDRVFLPSLKFLRSIIGDLDPTLLWQRSERPEELDRSDYEAALRCTASEIARVLRADGRLGLFWFSKDADDQENFLEAVQPAGFELIEACLFSENEGNRASQTTDHPLVLVFRQTAKAYPSDAETVLQGSLPGRKMKLAGLVDLINRYLDANESRNWIPDEYKAQSDNDRLRECLLADPDPTKWVKRINAPSLREYAISRGVEENALLGKDPETLSNMVSNLLGWQVPKEPSFSVGKALREAGNFVSKLRYSSDEELISGLVKSACSRIEDVFRFSVACWATRLKGDLWEECLDRVVNRRKKLSFGHWKQAFWELPTYFEHDDDVIFRVRRSFRKSEKLCPALDDLVSIRNDIIHSESDEGKELIDWMGLRNTAIERLNVLIGILGELDRQGMLPQVFRPEKEVRDCFDRITLSVIDPSGNTVEFLMTEPSDLGQPIVVLLSHRDTNPRAVDPSCLGADAVFARARLGR